MGESEEDADVEESGSRNNGTIHYHSRLEQAVCEVQGLMTSLALVEGKVRKAAQDLEVSEDVLVLFGEDQTAEKGPAFSLPPKRDQDADNISIADETEPGVDPEALHHSKSFQ